MVKAISTSTQNHLPVEDIVDDVVILKDGSAALVMQTTAVNFGLLSEKEQDAIIFAYAALLNSLTFPIQIVMRSKRTDISSYLELLDDAYQKQRSPDLKLQIGKYIDFVKATVQKGRVLDKQFYIIIPFSFFELGPQKALTVLTRRKKKLAFPKDYIIEQAKINLYPKKDQILKQLTRLGLAGRVLSQPELVELFFDMYNPGAVGVQRITAEAGTYTGPIVEPAVAAPPEVETQPQPPPPTTTTQTGTVGTQTQPPPPGSEQEKLLKELQVVVDKAKASLEAKTRGEGVATQQPEQTGKAQTGVGPSFGKPPGAGSEGEKT